MRYKKIQRLRLLIAIKAEAFPSARGQGGSMFVSYSPGVKCEATSFVPF
jgi:hypothetical protein